MISFAVRLDIFACFDLSLSSAVSVTPSNNGCAFLFKYSTYYNLHIQEFCLLILLKRLL